MLRNASGPKAQQQVLTFEPGVTQQRNDACSGADETLCLEAVMQNGWALQAATSHFLGQNFSKAFDCTFTNAAGAREHVWATSWGVSTRLIGACIMAHADDAGMVMPPHAAPVQVAVVPILGKDDAASQVRVREACAALVARLCALGLRAACDDSAFTNGEKFYGLERLGVPLRIDVGARDVASGRLPVTCRVPVKQEALAAAGVTGSLQPTSKANKFTIGATDDGKTVISLINAIHQQLLKNSASLMAEKVVTGATWQDMLASFNCSGEAMIQPTWRRASSRFFAAGASTDTGKLFLVPWCDDATSEAEVCGHVQLPATLLMLLQLSRLTKASIRCFPHHAFANTSEPDLQQLCVGRNCVFSGR